MNSVTCTCISVLFAVFCFLFVASPAHRKLLSNSIRPELRLSCSIIVSHLEFCYLHICSCFPRSLFSPPYSYSRSSLPPSLLLFPMPRQPLVHPASPAPVLSFLPLLRPASDGCDGCRVDVGWVTGELGSKIDVVCERRQRREECGVKRMGGCDGCV